MKTCARLAPLLMLLATAATHADDKAKHTFPSCRDCGIVRSIQPVRGPAVTPGGAMPGGAAGGVLGGRSGGRMAGGAGGEPTYSVIVQMDSGGTRTVTVRELNGLGLSDKVRVVGLNLERIEN